MNFDTSLIKISGELRKLWTIEYFNIGGMGHFENLFRFQKIKIHFIKVVILIKLVCLGENDCLSLECNIYKICSKIVLENLL